MYEQKNTDTTNPLVISGDTIAAKLTSDFTSLGSGKVMCEVYVIDSNSNTSISERFIIEVISTNYGNLVNDVDSDANLYARMEKVLDGYENGTLYGAGLTDAQATSVAKLPEMEEMLTAYKAGNIGSDVEVVDNLTTDDATKALSAKQGKLLNSQLVALTLQVVGNKLKLLKDGEVLSTVTLPSSSITAETYTITNTLSHCSTSNSATSIEEWSPYSATLTAESGYDLGSISVTMGGTNITSTAVSGSTINIDSVEGNLVITCTATEQPEITYTITNTLTHVTNSNTATSISENGSYTATLSASTGYILGTPVITIGGTDITSSAYNSSTNAISISAVTGNIVITCSATVDPNTVTVGSINSSNEISLTGLSSGTYTLKYEDADGTPLTDWDSICDMEVE